jgi:myo-inositol 2-dehydrogenase/D-chiro-inositol 1-dehydrogenase
MTTLGVIGLGRIGAFHTDTLSGLDSIDGLVVADERPDVVAAVAAKHGAKPVDSVEALLTSGVDGVVVSAATPAHAELTLAAVERGLPTFCEKPIAATAAESARVADVIARSGVPVQVGYQRRFDAAFAAAKRAVEDGSLGSLHTVRSTTMDPAPPPMEYIAASGGIFRDCAVHDFDVIRWITGQHAVEVYATGSVQGDPRFAEYLDVDTAAVVVTFDQGTLGVVSGSTTPSLPGGIRAFPCEMSTPTTRSRPDRPTTSSWTASPRRSAPNSPRSSTSSMESPPRHARWPTRLRSPGWRRRRPSRCSAVSRFGSRK